MAAVAALDAVLLIHGSNGASSVALRDFTKIQKTTNARDHFVFAVMDADVNDVMQLPAGVREGPWPRLLLIREHSTASSIDYDEFVGEITRTSLVAFLERRR